MSSHTLAPTTICDLSHSVCGSPLTDLGHISSVTYVCHPLWFVCGHRNGILTSPLSTIFDMHMLQLNLLLLAIYSQQLEGYYYSFLKMFCSFDCTVSIEASLSWTQFYFTQIQETKVIMALPAHYWKWYDNLLSMSDCIRVNQNLLYSNAKSLTLDTAKTMISVGAGKC